MLAHLSIRDFAIVERLDLELGPGMTVLTGETGAGKSILIDALGLTLGERASAKDVRTGADRAEVTAVFDLPAGGDATRYLESQDLAGDHECILRRTVSADGRSRAFVNGRPTALQTLRELGDRLVDIHGQHEHQSLLRAAAQRAILDAFGEHDAAIAALDSIVSRWRETRAAMEALAGGPEGREQRLDYLRYQVDELEALDVRVEELATLDEEHRRLSHANELLAMCASALETLDGEDDAAVANRLGSLLTGIEQMAAIDARTDGIRALIDGAGIQLREAAGELRRYQEGIDVDPGRLGALDERLAAIHDLARKHRTEPAELPALLDRLRNELEAIEGAGARLAELDAIERRLLSEYEDAAGTLHAFRMKAAEALSTAVTKNMRSLGMPGGSFGVAVEATREGPPSPTGWDSVRFEVAINPGQPPMPLARVASGGELSRISLAIQVIATRGSGIPTLIFDEVDAGIGGRVAEIVGRELRRLAAHRQVLCVTHLPQVASLAQQHVQVQKRSRRRETHTDLRSLSGEGRVEEIARMLGGVKITDQTLAHAREMLERG